MLCRINSRPFCRAFSTQTSNPSISQSSNQTNNQTSNQSIKQSNKQSPKQSTKKANNQSVSQTIKPVKGFHDLFPPVSSRYSDIENCMIASSKRFAYQEVRLPIVEPSRLFQRSINESEIVRKELFSFDDRSINQTVTQSSDNQTISQTNNVSLRPEGTSVLVRALINNQSVGQSIHRYWYSGPMFRRERPQKGRTRQFNQFGLECINDQSVTADIEVIDCAVDCLMKLGVYHACTLHINSLGDEESRTNYSAALLAWSRDRLPLLSADSRARFDSGNVLRILDSKDLNDQALIIGSCSEEHKIKLQAIIDESNNQSISQSNNQSIDQLLSHPAPLMVNYLNQISKNRFEALQSGLQLLKIDYVLDPYLVRGLDYYDHTAFEFKTHAIHQTNDKKNNQSINQSNNQSMSTAEYASQSTVLAGGRYNGLFSALGGGQVPAVGWAAGVDRLLLLQDAVIENMELKQPITFAVIAVRESNQSNNQTINSDELPSLDAAVVKLVSKMRRNELTVVTFLEKQKASKQLAQANKVNVDVCLIVGQSELDRGVVQVKWMASGHQQEVEEIKLIDYLNEKSRDIVRSDQSIKQ